MRILSSSSSELSLEFRIDFFSFFPRRSHGVSSSSPLEFPREFRVYEAVAALQVLCGSKEPAPSCPDRPTYRT